MSQPILCACAGADSRNPSTWKQADAARFLKDKGYEVFLMGCEGVLLKVDAAFFSETKILDEGYGPFIQGNALAVHKSLLAGSQEKSD